MLRCTLVPSKTQVCVLVWQMLFFKGLTCCHCWKLSWEPEMSFLYGRRCWDFSRLEQGRCLNSLHGANAEQSLPQALPQCRAKQWTFLSAHLWDLLQMRMSCSLCCAAALRTTMYFDSFKTVKNKTHFLLLFPPQTCSPERLVAGQGRVLVVVSCVNLCPPVSGHHNSAARLSQALFLPLLSWHLPSSLFYSTMIVNAGRKERREEGAGRSSSRKRISPPALNIAVSLRELCLTLASTEGKTDGQGEAGVTPWQGSMRWGWWQWEVFGPSGLMSGLKPIHLSALITVCPQALFAAWLQPNNILKVNFRK